MTRPRFLSGPPARWAVPIGVATTIGLAVGLVPVVAGASSPLPHRSAAQLLAGVTAANQHPFAGTIVETARLGLPALPSVAGAPTSLSSLVTGSHTARIWYAAPDRVRFALVGTLAETDVIRNGRDLWFWTSGVNTARHQVLPAGAGTNGAAPETPATAMTPQQAAQQALAAVDPSTAVTVEGTAEVAGRAAYELVLAPRDPRSLIGQVRLAVDSATSVPLRVRVYARNRTTPAFETAFTSIRFTTPASSTFRFVPPPGAKVSGTGAPAGPAPAGPGAGLAATGAPTVIGRGWTAVLVLRGVDLSSAGDNSQANALLKASTPVRGSYGSGRLLRTTLVSALLLDDGRLLVGAVRPALLTAAAAQPAAALRPPAAGTAR